MCIATECASVLCLFTAFFSFCYVEEERYVFFATFIHEKAMYRYVLDSKSALALELLFPGHLSST